MADPQNAYEQYFWYEYSYALYVSSVAGRFADMGILWCSCQLQGVRAEAAE
jgi:hypothetical protein